MHHCWATITPQLLSFDGLSEPSSLTAKALAAYVCETTLPVT